MNRIESLDILKGIGIILMIVAHTFGPDNFLWDCIYTFHIPLFFIVTGFFYKQSHISILIKKNTDRLLLQYLVICLIVIILKQIHHPHNIKEDITNAIEGMGPGCFLLAMFWSRLFFHFILNLCPNRFLLLSLTISIGTSFIAYNNNLQSYLSLFPALVSLFFIATGYYLQIHSFREKKCYHTPLFIIGGIIFWAITSLYGKVEMSQCIFKLSIIDFCGSLGGTYIAYKISLFINKHDGIIKKILSSAGKYSLVILFFHSIDYCIPIWHIIEPYFPSSIFLFIILFLRLLFVSICLQFTLNSKLLRSFFKI